MEEFAVLMLLGVRVREVSGLDEGHLWLPRRRLLLVDAALPRDDRIELTDWLITEATDLLEEAM